MTWAAYFAVTLVVEAPVVFALLAGAEPRWTRRLALVLLANLLTHPLVYCIADSVRNTPSAALLAGAECLAVVVEAVLYRLAIRNLTLLRAMSMSLIANALSLLAGIALERVLPPPSREGERPAFTRALRDRTECPAPRAGDRGSWPRQARAG